MWRMAFLVIVRQTLANDAAKPNAAIDQAASEHIGLLPVARAERASSLSRFCRTLD
jgi:hypothetical protein